jgi:hypothetical protein
VSRIGGGLDDWRRRWDMAYFVKLRIMRVPADEGLALLDLALDVPPRVEPRRLHSNRLRKKD